MWKMHVTRFSSIEIEILCNDEMMIYSTLKLHMLLLTGEELCEHVKSLI